MLSPMAIDSLEQSHPLRYDIYSSQDVNALFDDITYYKVRLNRALDSELIISILGTHLVVF